VREFCDLHFNFEIYKGIPRLRKLINSADARIAISTAIAEHWQMPTQDTWVINDACRKMNDACYVSNKEKYLLFSSYNLTEAKGTRIAIIAFAKSGVAKQGYILKLMGNCSETYENSLRKTMVEFGVENVVEFVPCQPNIKPYFAHATAYIMASECEGLGRVTAEAMFYGCPVVAHASGGTLDMVKDGKTGYLFHTIDECAELIKKVCTENQEKIILQAQQFAIEYLSQEIYGPKIMEVYESVLNEK
jgi:glycosyltransferase involved in cell wall biosynthesis